MSFQTYKRMGRIYWSHLPDGCVFSKLDKMANSVFFFLLINNVPTFRSLPNGPLFFFPETHST